MTNLVVLYLVMGSSAKWGFRTRYSPNCWTSARSF